MSKRRIVLKLFIAEACLVSILIASPLQLHYCSYSTSLRRYVAVASHRGPFVKFNDGENCRLLLFYLQPSLDLYNFQNTIVEQKRTIRDELALPYISCLNCLLLTLLTLTSLLTQWHICLHIMPYDRLWELDGVRVGMGRI